MPTVAVVAALEPLIAANSADPTILVCNRRPGRWYVSGDKPRNSLSDISVRSMSSPIQINIGIAEISQEVALRIISGAMILPMRSRGMSIRNTNPVVLTSKSPAKTH